MAFWPAIRWKRVKASQQRDIRQQTVGEYVAKHALPEAEAEAEALAATRGSNGPVEFQQQGASESASREPIFGGDQEIPSERHPSSEDEHHQLDSAEVLIDRHAYVHELSVGQSDLLATPVWKPIDSPLVGPQLRDIRALSETPRIVSANCRSYGRIQVDAGVLGPFWVAAGSVIGSKHSVEGSPRQDAYSFASSAKGAAIIVAVADGLGSKPFSQIGARSICEDASQLLSHKPFPRSVSECSNVVTGCLEEAQLRLLSVWAPANEVTEARELATTLVLAWIDSNTRRVFICRIGDSNAFMATSDGAEPFSSTFHSEEAPINAVSASLPTKSIHESLEVLEVEISAYSKIILCTDGLSDDIYESPAIRNWIADRLQQPCGERWMLETLSYSRKGSHDDRTAAVVWFNTPAAEQATSSQDAHDAVDPGSAV